LAKIAPAASISRWRVSSIMLAFVELCGNQNQTFV
jgi:hypothetical protein